MNFRIYFRLLLYQNWTARTMDFCMWERAKDITTNELWNSLPLDARDADLQSDVKWGSRLSFSDQTLRLKHNFILAYGGWLNYVSLMLYIL